MIFNITFFVNHQTFFLQLLHNTKIWFRKYTPDKSNVLICYTGITIAKHDFLQICAYVLHGGGGGMWAHVLRLPPPSLTHWPEKDKVWTFKSGITGRAASFGLFRDRRGSAAPATGKGWFGTRDRERGASQKTTFLVFFCLFPSWQCFSHLQKIFKFLVVTSLSKFMRPGEPDGPNMAFDRPTKYFALQESNPQVQTISC